MSKRKLDLEVGRKYRGYGYLNEYGEFQFEPENTGSRKGIIKAIASREGVSLSQTRDYLLVHIKINKMGSICNYFSEITKKVDILIRLIKDYEI